MPPAHSTARWPRLGRAAAATDLLRNRSWTVRVMSARSSPAINPAGITINCPPFLLAWRNAEEFLIPHERKNVGFHYENLRKASYYRFSGPYIGRGRGRRR